MLSRDRLWRRLSGASAWPLAWALAAACALPWLVPETWDGSLGAGGIALGWVLVLAAAPLVRSRRWAVVPLALALAWGTLGGLRGRARWERALPRGYAELEGRIAAPWTRRGDRLASTIEARGFEVGVDLPADQSAPPEPGTPVRVRAEIVAPGPAPAFLPERPLWRARSEGPARRLHLASAMLLEPLGPPAPSPALRLRLWARGRFEALPLEGPGRDLWGALALGIPPADPELLGPFAESGTLHVLVVSGLQVTLVMAVAEWLARRRLGRGSGLLASAAGVLYVLVVGPSAPVWRGLWMGFGWALGRGTGWRIPPAWLLHTALLLWLLGHPAAGCEPGFLLAWWALLGLLWGAEPLAGLVSPMLGRAALPLARLTAPWLATMPLLALLHGGVPAWGIVANLLVLPAVTVLTPLCLALTLAPLPLLTPGAAKLLTWIGLRALPSLARTRPLATGLLGPWLALLLGWPALAHAAARLRRTRALALSLALGSALLLATRGTGRAPDTLSLEAVDVGQGDALLLRVPGGDATLVDAGPSPWAARRIVETLSRRGVREPVHLVLTHPHSDHAGGWATLQRLWPPASTALPTTAGEDRWAEFRPDGARPEALRRGDGWSRGEAAFSVRWPPKPFDLDDANMVSLVLRARWRDRELWLMGDALGVQERDLLDLGEPGTGPAHRLLKPGHHGSRSSSDPAWVRALAPELAVIPAGRNNRFGHPHAETLETLKAMPTWITGPNLGVRVEAVPGGWRVETGLSGARTVPTPPAPR